MGLPSSRPPTLAGRRSSVARRPGARRTGRAAGEEHGDGDAETTEAPEAMAQALLKARDVLGTGTLAMNTGQLDVASELFSGGLEVLQSLRSRAGKGPTVGPESPKYRPVVALRDRPPRSGQVRPITGPRSAPQSPAQQRGPVYRRRNCVHSVQGRACVLDVVSDAVPRPKPQRHLRARRRRSPQSLARPDRSLVRISLLRMRGVVVGRRHGRECRVGGGGGGIVCLRLRAKIRLYLSMRMSPILMR